ncbi:MAG: hypothetical protein Pg6C_17040 [Treponemataceae bacterium]|nr:MAG: hypothetical protein Pg6C_17040 [Treponemataceae bacterium]
MLYKTKAVVWSCVKALYKTKKALYRTMAVSWSCAEFPQGTMPFSRSPAESLQGTEKRLAVSSKSPPSIKLGHFDPLDSLSEREYPVFRSKAKWRLCDGEQRF